MIIEATCADGMNIKSMGCWSRKSKSNLGCPTVLPRQAARALNMAMSDRFAFEESVFTLFQPRSYISQTPFLPELYPSLSHAAIYSLLLRRVRGERQLSTNRFSHFPTKVTRLTSPISARTVSFFLACSYTLPLSRWNNTLRGNIKSIGRTVSRK